MPDYAMMEAGPEMDVLVAEKVFGCNVKHDPAGCAYCACKPDDPIYPKHCDEDGLAFVSDYSEDIAAAWEVVEAMKAQRQKRLVLKEYSDGWYAAFGKRLDDTLWQAMQCDTAPLAICRAALMAAEKGEDDG